MYRIMCDNSVHLRFKMRSHTKKTPFCPLGWGDDPDGVEYFSFKQKGVKALHGTGEVMVIVKPTCVEINLVRKLLGETQLNFIYVK
jgi:hypothetical protein